VGEGWEGVPILSRGQTRWYSWYINTYVLCALSLSPVICCVLLVALFRVHFQLYHSQQANYVIRVQGDDLAYLFGQIFITG
jgi:hypothetical protein